jgi:hypothetical protein
VTVEDINDDDVEVAVEEDEEVVVVVSPVHSSGTADEST